MPQLFAPGAPWAIGVEVALLLWFARANPVAFAGLSSNVSTALLYGGIYGGYTYWIKNFYDKSMA